MPRAKESLKIEVTQSTAGEMRNIQITLTAPAQEFLLSDLLSQRGALTPFETILKQAMKNATDDYLARTEELIAGLTGRQKVHTSIPKSEIKSTGKEQNSNVRKRATTANEKQSKSQMKEYSTSHSPVLEDDLCLI